MKILSSQIAVLDVWEDLFLSRWVEDFKSLDGYDPRIRENFCPLIPVGGWIIDGGAFLGSHTIPYAQRVGEQGRVIAFEPLPKHLECLRFNTMHLSQITIEPFALYSQPCTLWMKPNKQNAGASVVSDETEVGVLQVQAKSIDQYEFPRLDFIKLDVEGLVLRALQGAERTLQKHRPLVVTEVGDNLELFGDSTEDLIRFMEERDYIAEEMPMFGTDQDMLFRPKEKQQ